MHNLQSDNQWTEYPQNLSLYAGIRSYLNFPQVLSKNFTMNTYYFHYGEIIESHVFFWNTKVICQDMVLIFDKLSLQSFQSFPYGRLFTYSMPLYPTVICLHSTLLDSIRFSAPWWKTRKTRNMNITAFISRVPGRRVRHVNYLYTNIR